MTRWHRGKAERGWLRHAAQDAKSGDKGGGRGSRDDTAAVDGRRNEMIDLGGEVSIRLALDS